MHAAQLSPCMEVLAYWESTKKHDNYGEFKDLKGLPNDPTLKMKITN